MLGLYAGALADRLDRRLLVVVVDLLRAGVLVVLAVAMVTGQVNIAVVLVAMFLLGVAEVFADTASGDPAADGRRQGGPRHRQRPADGRIPDHEPTDRPADRGGAVRRSARPGRS